MTEERTIAPQEANEMGETLGELTDVGLGIRVWVCSSCGASHDRDVNAARNILALALSAQRLAGESRGSAARQLDMHDPTTSV